MSKRFIKSTRQGGHTSAYLAALKKCTKTKDLEGGKILHANAVAAGCHTDKYVAAALIRMYMKCGSVRLAREAFDNTAHRDAVTWSALLLGYVENGKSSLALDLFTHIDCEADSVMYVAALKACAALARERRSEKQRFLEKGIGIHRQIEEQNLESNIILQNTLLDMYGKCGSMQLAREMFEKIIRKDVVTWNSLILGYVENGESLVALDLFNGMDCEPDHITYMATLKACARVSKIETGIAIHRKITELGLDTNTAVMNTLLDMYAKCGKMQRAREVFERMSIKNVVTWNCLVLGYVENGESFTALEFLDKMNCGPDSVTFVAALKTYAQMAVEGDIEKQSCLQKGMEIHKHIKVHGFGTDIVVGNTLLDMYGKCGSMQHAREVFEEMIRKDVVTWNCLIMGYVENGESLVALGLFDKMECKPDSITYIAVLKACASLRHVEKGMSIHENLKDHGYVSKVSVMNTLLDMYGKCGAMQRAREVFEGMIYKDIVTWNSLIMGYMENEEITAGMEMFSKMDCDPDHVTYVAVLKGCARLAMESEPEKQSILEKGIVIHRKLKESGCDSHIVVASALLDMYSKCGSVNTAMEIFRSMYRKDVVTWTSLILGYVEIEESAVALELFASMDCEPDCFTYAAVFKACGNLALLITGRWLHSKVCRLGMETDHVAMNSLIDMYGKCGSMAMAEELLNCMHSPNIFSCTALLTGYSSVGDSSRVFALAKRIREAGLYMDGVVFLCILTACSHAGLVEEGINYFEYMLKYGVRPNVEHYNCIVDMLGRANRLEEAVSLIKSKPFEADDVTWTTLLGACKKWKNVEVGKVAFDALVCENNRKSAVAYVMMRDIYRSLGMWHALEGMRGR